MLIAIYFALHLD